MHPGQSPQSWSGSSAPSGRPPSMSGSEVAMLMVGIASVIAAVVGGILVLEGGTRTGPAGNVLVMFASPMAAAMLAGFLLSRTRAQQDSRRHQ